MAKSSFFITRDDTASFLSFLIKGYSAQFFPNLSPTPPPFPHYTSAAEVLARIEHHDNCSRFHGLARVWEKFPLVVDEIHANEGQRFFAVSMQYGGPSFDLIVSRTWTNGLQTWIVAGHFIDYSYYVIDKAFLSNHSLYRTVDRPATIDLARKDIQNYPRRNGCRSVCREAGNAGPWILSGALSALARGTWLREGDRHFEPKPSPSKPMN